MIIEGHRMGFAATMEVFVLGSCGFSQVSIQVNIVSHLAHSLLRSSRAIGRTVVIASILVCLIELIYYFDVAVISLL